MEKFKLFLVTIVVLGILGIVGYWSINTIQSGTEYVTSKKVKQLEKENQDLKKEIQKQNDEISALQSKLEVPAPSPVKELEGIVATPTYKYQDLINELQKLASGNIFLKLKSQGPNVGTVQKFLNIYNKTSNRIDNDYGAGVKTAVSAFQKAEGLTADGEAGPSTFKKMIEWLKKQK